MPTGHPINMPVTTPQHNSSIDALTQPPVPADHTYRTLVILGGSVSVDATLLAQEYFDLVVVSATGSGLTEFFGSVATGIVRSANTNVLVVPISALIRPLRQVVLAMDYRSVNGAASFVFLKDLASRKATQLTLLTIETFRRTDLRAAKLSGQYVLKAFENVPLNGLPSPNPIRQYNRFTSGTDGTHSGAGRHSLRYLPSRDRPTRV